jgi:hypothetical protein
MSAVNTNKLRAMITALAKAFGPHKVLTLTGTTDAVAGNTVSVAHGIDFNKIISITGIVNDATTIFCPCSPTVTDLFSLTADAVNVNLTNGAAATAILAQPFVITIIYGE